MSSESDSTHATGKGSARGVGDTPFSAGLSIATIALTKAPDAAGKETVHDGPRDLGEPSEWLGRFEVYGEIGHGGMGAVLRGRDPALGRELALKVLVADLQNNTDALVRFHEEAQIGGQLQHPGLVPVYELGADAAGRPFFAMKLVDGRTLSALLKERASPGDNVPRWLTIFEQVCQTLAYAHARGVIHRDLKPANIMVGAFGEVQVMDWGLAKVLAQPRPALDAATRSPVQTARSGSDGSESRAGAVLGTPAYIPPEQARGDLDQIDRRADVFGLGGILCEILTGQPPFVGRNSTDMIGRAAAGDLRAAFSALDTCGADLELLRLAKACLAPEPRDRPTDGSAVAAVITAYRAGVAERLRRAEIERAAAEARAREERRRRRAQLALAGALVLLVALGASGGWYIRQQHLQHEAELARQETERVRRGAERARAIERGLGELAQERQKPRPDWNRAEQLLQRVEGRLEQGDSDELNQRVHAVREDLARVRRDREMVARLDEARLRLAAAGDAGFDRRGSRNQYAEAFAWYGLDVTQGPVAAVVPRIVSSPLREELVIALDKWAGLSEPEPAERLQAIADQADDNMLRRDLRGALQRKDHARIRRLGDDAKVTELPAASLVYLAQALRRAGAADRAVSVLRVGRQRDPDDVWLNFELAAVLHTLSPPQLAEAVRYYTAAQALRPESVGILNNLGIALKDQRHFAEAAHTCAKAIRFKPDYPVTHNNLGVALQGQGKLAEAVDAYREAIKLDAAYHPAHSNLGNALTEMGKLAEGVAVCREAIRLQEDFAHAHVNLGIALKKQSNVTEAIASYRDAIRHNPNLPSAHNNLGLALSSQNKLPEAVKEFREALRLDPNYAHAHYNLGVALHTQGKAREALEAYREAIRLDPDRAEAHCNIGAVLRDEGDLRASLEAFRRGHALGQKTPGWSYPSEKMVKEAERLVELDRRLLDVLAGRIKPAGAREQIDFAAVCIARHRYLDAVRLSADAFTSDMKLANDLAKGYRYNAACSAVLAAAGKDVLVQPDKGEQARLRGLALGWLRDEVAALGKLAEGAAPAKRAFVQSRLRDAQNDDDLASVRNADAIARLPESERGDWNKLWQEVESLRRRAAMAK
jgi:serine/threonine-protein kinase